jgi:hypothetical protein
MIRELAMLPVRRFRKRATTAVAGLSSRRPTFHGTATEKVFYAILCSLDSCEAGCFENLKQKGLSVNR